MAGRGGRRTGMGNEGEELVNQLKRIFTALQTIVTSDTNITAPVRGRGGRFEPGFFNRHVRTRGRAGADLIRSAGAASPYGVARGMAGLTMGPMGMAATVAGAGLAVGATATRFTGERLNRLTRPGEVSSLKSAELQASVVDKATLGIGGGWLRAAWNVTGYTDLQSAVSATRDDVMGLARSAFEAGVTPKKGYIEQMAKTRFKKQKEWIERRDEVNEAVEAAAGREMAQKKGESEKMLVDNLSAFGSAIVSVTRYLEELGQLGDTYRKVNRRLEGAGGRG